MSVSADRLNRVAPPLIGRDDVLAAAAALLAHPATRLISITGPAGVGKTRIAAELIAAHGGSSGRQIIAIDLAALRDAGDIDAELARAAGFTAATGEPITEAVERWLAGRHALILLDNAEHLLGIGPRIAAWLATAPGLRVVVTSRQRLNLSMETELELDPLEIEPARPGAMLSPAGELFARLAGADEPARLPADTRAAIERLAARLEGLPLALELVAARLPELDSAHIGDLLESTDTIARALPTVASALDVAVARSYNLLTPPAQTLLRYLTIFAGGFTVELVERLVAHAPVLATGAGAVTDLLDELTAHHLVLTHNDPRFGARFTILAMVAEAVGRLREERGETEVARAAHARAVLDFAVAREYAGFRPGHEHEVAELGASFHNLMAAISWLDDQRDADGLARLVGALTWFWYSHGHYAHGLQQYERASALHPVRHGHDWARFELGRGVMLDLVGQFEDAHDAMLAGLAAYTAAGSVEGAAAANIALGINAFHLGRFDAAQAALERAIQHAHAIPDRDLGSALEAVALANLGANAHERGDAVIAEVSLRRAVEIHEGMRYLWGAARGLCDLGGVLRDTGRHAEALATYQRALEPARSLTDHRLIAVALAGIASVIIADDQPRLGSWIFGGVAALRPVAGQPSYLHANEVAWQRARESARAAIGHAAVELAWRAGGKATIDDLVDTGLRATLLGPEPFPAAAQALTRQERSVLRMVLQDLRTSMIAELLGITERTVNSHLSAIFRKVGVNSRLELLALASHHRGQRGGA